MLTPIITVTIINLLTIIWLLKADDVSWFYSVNLMLMFTYNFLGWAYIFKYLDAGGASLGPGLALMFLSALHIVLLVVFAIIQLYISRIKTKRNKTA